MTYKEELLEVVYLLKKNKSRYTFGLLDKNVFIFLPTSKIPTNLTKFQKDLIINYHEFFGPFSNYNQTLDDIMRNSSDEKLMNFLINIYFKESYMNTDIIN